VILLTVINSLVPSHRTFEIPYENLANLAVWAGILAITAYAMGTLYERIRAMTNDIRESFSGLLVILQHFIAHEQYSQGENRHVLDVATKTAEVLGLGSDRIEYLRSAIVLRDMSKLGITHDMLYKAANVTREEVVESLRNTHKADPRAQSMGGSLRRVIPIIVAQQILLEQGARALNVPMEAHVLAVADAYQKLTTGRTEGKALSPRQAEKEIMAGSGERFHSGVVDAFVKAFSADAHGAGAGA
jgi:HD-GYP domain-containing protein (c-di-GMP phosphodiesterase class II)